MLENLDLSGIQEENARKLVKILLNQIEELSASLRDAHIEIQQLRDENNRLKGEQGKPNIKGNVVKPAVSKHSSEKERQKKRERHKKSKNASLVVNREEVVPINLEILPADTKFKGYEEIIIQDIVMQADNVRFRKEKYYSASEQKTYLAELPAGYEGQFGPGLKALIPALHFCGGMTEPKALEFLGYIGIQISPAQISGMLIKNQEVFHAESKAVFEAGLRSSPHQNIDDTPTRVNGQNQVCHILCNPLYASFYTREHKDRLTILDILRNGRPRTFRPNAEAMKYLKSQPFSTCACGTGGKKGKKILAALRDRWKTGINGVGAPRPDTISPIPEGIPLLEAEKLAREREPGDGTAQKSVVKQIEAVL
jgi:hypothetical protein